MGLIKEAIKKIPGVVPVYRVSKERYQILDGYVRMLRKFGATSKEKILLNEDCLSKLTYQDLYQLHYILNSKQYNAVMKQIGNLNTKRLSYQERIKVSFILYDSAMWCGNLLYEQFKKDPRFDVEVLLCEPVGMLSTSSSKKNFLDGEEKLRNAGVNVRILPLNETYHPDADILFFLTPYFHLLNEGVRIERIPLSKLIVFVDYAMYTSAWWIHTKDVFPMHYLAWREFVDTRIHLEDLAKYGFRHGEGVVYTGYPRMDTFYIDSIGNYGWKLVTPNAKKIIWAPHWSINGGVNYATFQKNYLWFYDYAKEHPKTTSWVVKPHPNLMSSAVESGVFKTDNEFHAYINAWNLLPNAKVETGAYYQDIFKTSDAMILDSGSFTTEYPYTHKPELFLTREGEKFSAIGKAILNAEYTADGGDFTNIQKFIEDVVIKGKNSQKEKYEKIFKQHLDYRATLGKLASENIYEKIKEDIFL